MMVDELDGIIRRSLASFVDEVFSKTVFPDSWLGMEREAVSFFAFGHLARECREGSILSDFAQIGIEVRVPRQSGGQESTAPHLLTAQPKRSLKETRVCKDLVIWKKRGSTWLSADPPLAVMEWKVFGSWNRKIKARVSEYDVTELLELSNASTGFTGYVVCLDMLQRQFRLSCTRVVDGKDDPQWMVVPSVQ